MTKLTPFFHELVMGQGNFEAVEGAILVDNLHFLLRLHRFLGRDGMKDFRLQGFGEADKYWVLVNHVFVVFCLTSPMTCYHLLLAPKPAPQATCQKCRRHGS